MFLNVIVLLNKSHWTTKGDLGYKTYEEGFDPDVYREGLIKEILSSNSFINLWNKFTKKGSKYVFILFGNQFCINLNNRLEHILNLSLVMYNVRMSDLLKLIEDEFKDLYFCIHENKFEIEIQTALLNLDSIEGELLNHATLKVYFKKDNQDRTFINYKLIDEKI